MTLVGTRWGGGTMNRWRPLSLLCMGFVVTPLAPGVSATSSASNSDTVAPADTVLQKGFIYTVDSRNSVAQSIAIRAGRIVYVGSDQGTQPYIGQHTRVFDLHGKMVMPGLVDAH